MFNSKLLKLAGIKKNPVINPIASFYDQKAVLEGIKYKKEIEEFILDTAQKISQTEGYASFRIEKDFLSNDTFEKEVLLSFFPGYGIPCQEDKTRDIYFAVPFDENSPYKNSKEGQRLSFIQENSKNLFETRLRETQEWLSENKPIELLSRKGRNFEESEDGASLTLKVDDLRRYTQYYEISGFDVKQVGKNTLSIFVPKI